MSLKSSPYQEAKNHLKWNGLTTLRFITENARVETGGWRKEKEQRQERDGETGIQ